MVFELKCRAPARGAVIWTRPLDEAEKARKTGEKERFLRTRMSEECLKTCNAFVAFMSVQSKRLIDPGSWYLSILGIAPEFQGRGVGHNLVSQTLEKTDSLAVPTYLETFTPRSIPFYERLGYTVVRAFREPAFHYWYWLMFRPPTGR